MKKIVLIIFIAILSLCTAEFVIYSCVLRDYKNSVGDNIVHFPPPGFFESYKVKYTPAVIQYYDKEKEYYFRPVLKDDNNTKRPIFLFGCSFTHGTGLLDDNQTIGYKLFKLTRRNVYNFGICCGGIQHMLFCIQKFIDKYYDEDKSPEYAVYTYIPDHLFQRLRVNVYPFLLYNGTMIHYKFNDSKLALEQKQFPFLYKSFIVKSFLRFKDNEIYTNSIKQKYINFSLANEIFLESKRELKKRYPDIKFVILRYRTENDGNDRFELPFMWDTLKSEGFIVLDSEELIGRQFKMHSEDTCSDGSHPSEYAWELLIPEVVKKLDM